MIDRIPFALNIIILLPVCYAMFFNAGGELVSVMDNKVADSPGLRSLIASFWLAILLCSFAAIYSPDKFASVLVIQFIYKLAWLIVFILPLIRVGADIPWGITNTFLLIIILWPFFIYRAFLP